MKAKIAAMYDAGYAMQDIADTVGVSRQRVHQIIDQMRPKRGKGIRKHHKRLKEVNHVG